MILFIVEQSKSIKGTKLKSSAISLINMRIYNITTREERDEEKILN
jgi:hypothetical protein